MNPALPERETTVTRFSSHLLQGNLTVRLVDESDTVKLVNRIGNAATGDGMSIWPLFQGLHDALD